MSRSPLRRAVVVGATALLLTSLGAGAARADEPAPAPSPGASVDVDVDVDGDQVTLTTDLATARAACARVDTARDRLTRLVGRIQADAGTTGSVAWLRDRAERAADEGRDDQSGILAGRADRRAGWVDDLEAAIARLDAADATVCAALPPADR